MNGSAAFSPGWTIVVTGAGGFIGRAVVGRLAETGARVRAHLGPEDADLTAALANISVARGPIDEPATLDPLLEGAAVVVHLAGPPSVAASFAMPARYARDHVAGTATVLDSCRRHGVARIVYVSSAEVYGGSRANPVGEEAPPRPCSPYAAAKLGAEHLVGAFARAFGQEGIILRPFSVYGPGSPARALVPTLIAQARSRGTIVVRDTRPIRDYCFLADLTDAIVCACRAPLRRSPCVYNVGSGAGVSVGALARLVLELADHPTGAVIADPSSGPLRPIDILELVADVRLAASELGWVPRTPLATGLAATIGWMDQCDASS
jgi:UDP-glucose 4-epimerase